MAGGGYRDKFRQAFHNAQQDGNQIFTHVIHSFFFCNSFWLRELVHYMANTIKKEKTRIFPQSLRKIVLLFFLCFYYSVFRFFVSERNPQFPAVRTMSESTGT